MSKKLVAISVAVLMLLSVFAVVTPAKAATAEGVTVFLRPGVEDPYHPGWSQTLGTLWDHEEEVVNKYLDYAILASTETSASIGDLQFDITIDSVFQGGLEIYIPYDFDFMKPDGTPATTNDERRFNIWTDITNDYAFVWVRQMPWGEGYAPGWWRIRIGYPRFQPTTNNDPLWLVGTTWDPGTYHVRLMNMKAPTQAGVYHFKIGMGTWPPFKNASPNAFDPRDWPIMIVKTELNPAYVTGEVALCVEPSCTFSDVDRYGKVWLEGTTPEGRTVSAVYYMSPEDTVDTGFTYTYHLFGVAAGTYTLYASAGGPLDAWGGTAFGGPGYPKGTGLRFEVLAGQSKHIAPNSRLYLFRGPSVDVTVYSKHGRGELPWGSLWQPPYGTNDPTVVDLNKPRPLSIDLHDAEGNWLMWTAGTTDPLATSLTVSFPGPTEETGYAPALLKKTVNAFASGAQYELKVYVTGYVMLDEDAWQRTFTVSGSTHVSLDLRRSNWFEIRPHIEFDLPTVPTTLVLAAEQDGVEKGVTSLLVNPTGTVQFWDSGLGGTYGTKPFNIALGDHIILEGWSHRYMWSTEESDPAWKDYGLMPGTYEIKMYMADMGDQSGRIYGTPGVVGHGWYSISGAPIMGSISLCNSPSEISFWVASNKLKLTIRSVDWQTPAHPRPWTFPGAEISVDILDADGNVVDSLSPDLWGLVQDDGSIIDPVTGLNTYYARSDDDLVNPPFPGEDTQLTVVFTGNDYGVFAGFGPDGGLPISYIGAYPTHIAPGVYKYALHTLGYVERRVFPNDLSIGGMADIQVDLIQGAQIRVLMDFYKEFANVAFNGWVRVEVFNDAGELVGASIYGMADVNPLAPGEYAPWDPTMVCASPGGPDCLEWKIVQEPAEGAGSDAGYGQRAYISSFFYGNPGLTFAGYTALNPIDANRLQVPGAAYYNNLAGADVFGFYRYFGEKSSRNDDLWANGWETTNGKAQADNGLRGSTDGLGITGGGLYTVKVWAFDPLGPDGEPNTADDWQSYYMGSDVAGVEVPWGGVTTVVVHMQQYGRISGFAAWSDMYGNIRNMPWLEVTASSPEGAVTYTTPGMFDDDYYMWLPAGTHDVSAQVAVAPQILDVPGAPFVVAVSPGFNTVQNIACEPTGVPVPEFALAPLVALSALAASLYVLRRRRK